MTETLTRPTYSANPDDYTHKDKIVAPATEVESSPTPETPDTPRLSPTGRALDRVADLLHNRANESRQRANENRQRILDTAHEDALDEYRDNDLAGYSEHMFTLGSGRDAKDNLVDGVTDEQKEYAENRLNNDVDLAHEEALQENRRFDRREARKEMKDKAKAFLRRVGRRALGAAKTSGLIGLGLGVMGAQATARGARHATASAKEAYYNKRGEMAENAQMRQEAAQERKDERKAARAERKEEKRTRREELEQAARNEAIMRARAAERRKQERRQRWSRRIEKVGNAFRATANFTSTQKKRLGRLGRRAKATGKAAVDTWKSFEK